MATHLILLALAVFLVLNDRLFIRLDTGGSGLVRVMDIGMPFIAALLLAFGSGSSFRRMYTSHRVQCWLPYLAFGLVLPVLGVFGGDYPLRTMFSAIVSIRALALIALGAWLGQQPRRVWILAARWMVFCIALETLIAACQFVTLQQLFDAPFLRWLQEWDVQSMTAYKDAYLVGGRSSGTFVGANSLGPWSVFAVWFSVTMLKGVPRAASIAASLLVLVLSQSRGSIFAFLASALVALATTRAMKRATRLGLTTAIVFAAILASVVYASLSTTLQPGGMSGRFVRGFGVLSEGASADPSVQGRAEMWSDCMRYFAEHPLGTWGEVQVRLQAGIDSQYVGCLLQGSLPFAMALVLGLYGGIRPRSRRPRMGVFLTLSTVSIAMNCISASMLAYSSIGIYWLVMGYSSTAPWEAKPGDEIPQRAGLNRVYRPGLRYWKRHAASVSAGTTATTFPQSRYRRPTISV